MRRLNLCSIALLSGLLAAGPAPASTVNFTGSVRLGACTIHPDDEDMGIALEDMVDRDFYDNPPRTRGTDFTLRLLDCKTSVVDGVKITFSGLESTVLPGLLAPDPGSTASGVAIGLETASGTPLPLDVQSGEYALAPGDNTLAFRAYVQGEPDAIANRTIGLGPFTATATFELEYL